MKTLLGLNLDFFNSISREDYSAEMTVPAWFETRVRLTPDRVAVQWEDKHISYKELNVRAHWLAVVLVGRGVKPGRAAAVMMKPSLEMIIVIMGVVKAGGAYILLDPELSEEYLLSMVKDSRASLLLTETGVIESKSFTSFQGLQAGTAEIRVTAARPQIMDFESLPIPDRSLVDYEKYHRYIGMAPVKRTIALQATRGCPFKCAYCHNIWPKKHVVRSARHVFAELNLYYRMGIRRFTFIDDIFNLDGENSRRFFQMVVDSGLKVQLFFPNGMRGDILTKDYIDLMVKAGTVNVALALETASPRLQKLIHKNLNIQKFRENVEYFCHRYPQVIVDLFTMHGFPTETREEAMMTLDFIKNIRWLHFPFVFLLKIYPNTSMAQLAVEQGIRKQTILKSENLFFHQLSGGLQFEKSFTIKYQADFLHNYFLSKERLLHVLPFQTRILSEDEIVQKYNSYLPVKLHRFQDLLDFVGIPGGELSGSPGWQEKDPGVPGLNGKIKAYFPGYKPADNALKILLLDLTLFFSSRSYQYHELVEPPLGLMYLLTYLNQRLGSRVQGKIAKSGIDFDSYEELEEKIRCFKPDVIGIRTLTSYKDFLHQTAALIRQWGFNVPIISGGPYATSSAGTLLQDPHIDLVVLGEGEITFYELIAGMLENNNKLPGEDVLKNIKGIAFQPREQGKKAETPRGVREIIFWDRFPGLDSKYGEDRGLPWISKSSDPVLVTFGFTRTGKSRGIAVQHHDFIDFVRKGHQWMFLGKPLSWFEWLEMKRGREGNELHRQEAYWLKQLTGGVHPLHRVTDFERTGMRSFEGKQLAWEIGEHETAALKALALRENAGPGTLLLALVLVLLFKLSRQEDIIIGSAEVDDGCVGHPGLSRFPGPFVNILPLRTFPRAEMKFGAFLLELVNSRLHARENQDYPYEDLVDRLELEQGPTDHPNSNSLFDVMFVYWPHSSSHPGVEPFPPGEAFPCDLTFTGVDKDERLMFFIGYDDELFKAETIKRYSDYFREILRDVLENNVHDLCLQDIRISHGLIDQKLDVPSVDFGF
jgi:radical SAM superfamily enzyme YgiQ (UPF0313 family)